MMKLIIYLSILIILFAGCRKSEEQTGESVPQEPKAIKEAKEALKKVEEALSKEITESNFQKGRSLSTIKLKSLKTDTIIDLNQFKGKKIMIDFWSSWCLPCIEMFPDLNRLKKEYEDEKGILKVITISVDPMPEKVLEVIKEKNALFEVLQAPELLQNAGILLPFTVFVDETGVVKETMNGKHSFEELKKFIGVE